MVVCPYKGSRGEHKHHNNEESSCLHSVLRVDALKTLNRFSAVVDSSEGRDFSQLVKIPLLSNSTVHSLASRFSQASVVKREIKEESAAGEHDTHRLRREAT